MQLPQLEALEARALALQRRRAAFLCERRRADVQDQALDAMAAGTCRPAQASVIRTYIFLCVSFAL